VCVLIVTNVSSLHLTFGLYIITEGSKVY